MMKKKNNMANSNFFFLLLTLLVVSISCQRGIDNLVGGASDTEVSATIKGEIKDLYGNPVSDGKVLLKPRDYTPFKKKVNFKRSVKQEGFAFLDGNGKFSIDSISKGKYLLEVLTNDSSLGIAEEISIDSNENIYKILTVKPLGAISGYVEFPYVNGNLRSKTRIEVLGTEHFKNIDTITGYFTISLPEGSHKIKITADSEVFDEIIIENINVISNQPKFIGTIRLNYKFPEPACWNYSCDSAIVRQLLDSNGHSDIPVEKVSFKSYERITVLDLQGISLSKNLELISKLNALEVLNLSNTGISDSCRFLCALWNLKRLRLNNNNITGLSRCIEGLVNLRVLEVANNSLTTLPERIIFLYLEKVDLSGNKLCNLSDGLYRWATVVDGDWQESQKCDIAKEHKQ